jgi:hypothetical protein
VSSSQAFEAVCRVVGDHDVVEVSSQLIVAVVVEALEGGILHGAVQPLDLVVIRHVGSGVAMSCRS